MPRLRTLGRLELVDGESPATVRIPTQRKRLALLAYLVLATPRGPHRRDTLLALFWPEADEDDARRSLRQSLHAIRGWLGDGVLQSSPDDQVGLAAAGLSCDATELEHAVADGRFTDAVTLYQGAFMDGVFAADVSADFEQWVDLTRQRLRQSAASASTQLAIRAAQDGDGAAAIRWATSACGLAPDDEPSVRLLMEALRDAGDHAGALRTYEVFAHRMAEDFEASPAPQTQALRTAIRTRSASLTTSAAGDAPAPESVVPPKAHIAPPAGFTRRTRRLTIATAAVVAACVGYLLNRARQPSNTVSNTPDRILVVDFRNRTRDSLIGGAVTEALRTDLAQSRVARVMSRSQVQGALQRMQQPPGEVRSDAMATEIAEREGVKAIVTGEIATVGTGYIVSAQLLGVRGGEILAAARETAVDSSHLLGAVDAVSARMRRGIGESLWAVRSSPPLEQVTTSSLQALRLYSLAIRIGDNEGDDRRAVSVLRQAIAADTTFAMAYRKLGVYLRDFDERAGADEALSKAFRYRDRLPELERYGTIGMYYSNAGLPDSALAAYAMLLARYPADMRGLNNIGLVYEDRKEFKRAESYFRRALDSDSSVALLYNHLATVQLNAGEYEAASHTLAVRRRKFAPQIDAEEIEIPLAIMRGDFAEAQRHADGLMALSGTDAGDQANALTVHAGLAIMRGRLGDADHDRQAIMEIEARAGLPGGYLDGAVSSAFADIWYRRQASRGLQTIEEALAHYPLSTIAPLDRGYAFLSYTYALGGRPTRARALLAELRSYESVPGKTPGGLGLRDEGGYLRSWGTIQLAEGQAGEAVITLRRAAELSTCPTCALPDLARAYEATGQRDSAIVTYERYVSTPWSDWQLAGGEFRGTAYGRLGALYEQRGDTAHAARAYARLADLWSAADSELQPQVADARRRAAYLAGFAR